MKLGFADEILFDEKGTSGEVTPDELDEDESGGSGEPQDTSDKAVKLGGLVSPLYSSRRMGLTILNRLNVRGTQADTTPPPVLGMDGKMADGAMPYELLKKQLDLLR